MISPLPDSLLQKALGDVSSDAVSSVKVSPPADFIRRIALARSKSVPEPKEEILSGINAARLAQYLTPSAGIGALSGAVQSSVRGDSPEDIVANALQGGRTGALLNPIALALKSINAPTLRSAPRYEGDEALKLQSLLQQAISRLQ